jgi:hypothetical protein
LRENLKGSLYRNQLEPKLSIDLGIPNRFNLTPCRFSSLFQERHSEKAQRHDPAKRRKTAGTGPAIRVKGRVEIFVWT